MAIQLNILVLINIATLLIVQADIDGTRFSGEVNSRIFSGIEGKEARIRTKHSSAPIFNQFREFPLNHELRERSARHFNVNILSNINLGEIIRAYRGESDEMKELKGMNQHAFMRSGTRSMPNRFTSI